VDRPARLAAGHRRGPARRARVGYRRHTFALAGVLTRIRPRAEVEAGLLARADVDVVIGDIPPLAFAAAARAALPSYGLTNFTWDWIYAAWPDFEDIIDRVCTSYGLARGLLRLPLHAKDSQAFAAFVHVEDVPLIARKASRPAQVVRAELGLPLQTPVVLLSFGGFAAGGLDLMRLGSWRDYRFVITPPLAEVCTHAPANVLILNESPVDYVSLLAACDAVVTKPGYGIVADCLANHVAVLFTDRGPFREYDVLAEALPRLGRARFVARHDLLAGELGPHLDALLACNMPWSEQALDGAEVVAERVLASGYD
jgi:L-arabinokinase